MKLKKWTVRKVLGGNWVVLPPGTAACGPVVTMLYGSWNDAALAAVSAATAEKLNLEWGGRA